MKTVIRILDHSSIPESVNGYFIKPIDGYAYLVSWDRVGTVEFRHYCYGDSHPWKDYPDSDELVAKLSRVQATNLLRSVRSWNRAYQKKQARRKAEQKELDTAYYEWINSLPEWISCLQREGDELLDSSGNCLFSLNAGQLRFKSIESIESFINELFEECFDPGA